MSAVWAFIKSPLGLAIVAFIALMAYVQIQRADAAKGAKAECNATQIQADADELQRKLDIATSLADEQRQRADKTEADMATLEKDRDDLLAEMAADKSNTRNMPPSIVDRMRTRAAAATARKYAHPITGRP